MLKVRCLSYPCSLGSSKGGHETAPHAVFNLFQNHFPNITWHPSFAAAVAHDTLPPLGSAARVAQIAIACTKLTEEVAQACHDGYVPVAIGGDHSMSIGSIAGFAQAHANEDVGLLWIDAHLDSNTPATSPSQAIHGMPLATLLGYGHPELVSIGSRKTKIKPQNICMLGSRAVDVPELEFLYAQGVRVVSMREIEEMGIKNAIDQAWNIISQGTTQRYLSLDLDSIDPADAPGVGIPEPGGIPARALLEALQTMMHAGGFAGYDIAEYHPASDIEGKTACLIQNVLRIIAE